MTVGNPKLVVRVTEGVLEQIHAAIRKRNSRSRDEPWDVSAFVRTAIRDKLAHLERSRRSRRAGRSSPAVAKTLEG